LSATFLSSLSSTPEWLLTPSVPASVNSAISAASALIPFPSSDFQPSTFDFQPPLRCYPPACPNPVEAVVRKSSPYFASSLPPYFLFSKPFPYLVTSLLPYFLFSKPFPYLVTSLLPYFLFSKPFPYLVTSLLPYFLFSKPFPYLVTSLLRYLFLSKFFICNTYAAPRKCCKQKTYGLAKPFRCNIYKKPGEGY
jgi:hypothetical protein